MGVRLSKGIALRKGIKIRIMKDETEGGSATGKLAKFIGFRKDKEGWLLYDETGLSKGISPVLPDNCIEWVPLKEKFPEVKCGVRQEDPIFLLDNGAIVFGSQCEWMPENRKIQSRFTKDLINSMTPYYREGLIKELKKLIS